MNRMKILLLAILTFSLQSLKAQESKVFDNLTMNSKIRTWSGNTPFTFQQVMKLHNAPTLCFILLHGAGDDQTGWVQFGEVQHIADKAIKEVKSHCHDHCHAGCQYGRRGYLTMSTMNGEGGFLF